MKTVDIITDLIDNHLDLDSSSFVIVSARRLGRIIKPRAPHLGPQPKPPARHILVTFCKGVGVDFLIRNAYKLKGTNVGFSRD